MDRFLINLEWETNISILYINEKLIFPIDSDTEKVSHEIIFLVGAILFYREERNIYGGKIHFESFL